MTMAERTQWPVAARTWDTLVAVLRVTLGLVMVIPGLKVIFPSLIDLDGHGALADKFTNHTTGFLAPWLVERIEDTGISVETFLLVKGLGDTAMGLMLIFGLGVRMNATILALFFWSFTIAAPVGGGVRLARDVGLAVLCVALVRAGAGRWSLDRRIARTDFAAGTSARDGSPLRRLAYVMFRKEALPAGNRDGALLLLRLGVAFPLLTSAIFAGGPSNIFDNPANKLLPGAVLLVVAVALIAGVAPRWVMTGVALLMAWLVLDGWAENTSYIGLDNMKREIPFMAAAAIYAIVGPDRWSWPRPARIRCSEASGLLMAYVDGSLETRQRDTLENHFSDCPDCWRYLASYRETIELGKGLREDTIPAAVRERLEATLTDT